MGLPYGCFALSSYLHCLIWLHIFWYARSCHLCSMLHVSMFNVRVTVSRSGCSMLFFICIVFIRDILLGYEWKIFVIKFRPYYFFRWPPPTFLASIRYVSSDRRISREPFSSCIPGAFNRLSLGIAQVGTPWRVGNKRVALNFIKNSAYVYARGLLDLVWGYEPFVHRWRPSGNIKMQDGNKSPVPW